MTQETLSDLVNMRLRYERFSRRENYKEYNSNDRLEAGNDYLMHQGGKEEIYNLPRPINLFGDTKSLIYLQWNILQTHNSFKCRFLCLILSDIFIVRSSRAFEENPLSFISGKETVKFAVLCRQAIYILTWIPASDFSILPRSGITNLGQMGTNHTNKGRSVKENAFRFF